MSVKDKIEEIKTDIAAAYEAVSNKGGSIPSVSGSANLAQAIASIPEGGGSSELEYEWWSPKMTSDTTPEPYVVSADSFNGFGVEAYRAFDGNKNTSWMSTGRDENHWIQIDIAEKENVAIAGLSLSPEPTRYENFPSVFNIQGSNDGSVWKDILKVDEKNNPIQEDETSREYYFKESHYRYYRLYITDWLKRGDDYKVLLLEILFYRAIGNSYADAVTSFNGRTGDILPQDGDYSAENISFSSGSLKAGNVKEAIEELANNPKEETQSTFLVKAPVGTIVIWSGTEDDIPNGWQLCDGTNGTPNLKDKFVLGAGEKYSVGDEGGEEEVTLALEQIPAHSHRFTSYTNQGKYVSTSSSASNILPVQTEAGTKETGGSKSHNNMPPYYALCYIMKVTPDDTDISAEDVIFEPGETGLEATNIQQAIEELAERGGGSSGGTVTPDLSDVSSMKSRQVTLLSTLWEEDGTQTVPCSDVIENDKGQLIVTIPDPNDEDAYFQSNIRPVKQLNDKITFHADTIPDSEIVVDVYIIGAAEIKEQINGEFEWWSPKMTSDTTPEPYVASANSFYWGNSTTPSPTQGSRPYKAFDNSTETTYRNISALLPGSEYLQFDFGESTWISGIRIYIPEIMSNSSTSIDQEDLNTCLKRFSFVGSNDNDDWKEIYTATGEEYPEVTQDTHHVYNFKPVKYRYYKLIPLEVYSTDSQKVFKIYDMQFYKLKEETT